MQRPLVAVGGVSRPKPRPAADGVTEKMPPDLLMKVVGTIVVSSVWRFQDVIPGLSATKLPLVATVAGVLILLMDMSPARSLKRLKSPITWLLLALCVQLIIAMTFSLSFGRSRSFMTRDFVMSVITMILIVCSVRTVRDLRWLIVVDLVGAAIFSVLVLLRFRYLDSSGRLCCIPYYDANDVSLVLVTTLPFLLYFLRDNARANERIAVLVALAPIFYVFLLAGSRGGFLGLITIVVCTMFGYRGIKRGRRFWALAGGVAALLLFGGAEYREKIVSIFHPKNDYNVTEPEGRIEMWKSGISLAKQRPLVGYGPRSFGEAYGRFSDRAMSAVGGGVPWRAAHNAYVELMVEGGVPALLAFAAMIITAIVLALRFRKQALDPRLGPAGQQLALLAQSNAIGLVGYVVSATFLSAEYLTILYMMVGMTIVIGNLTTSLRRKAGAEEPMRGRRVAAPRRALAKIQPTRRMPLQA